MERCFQLDSADRLLRDPCEVFRWPGNSAHQPCGAAQIAVLIVCVRAAEETKNPKEVKMRVTKEGTGGKEHLLFTGEDGYKSEMTQDGKLSRVIAVVSCFDGTVKLWF